MTILEDAAGRAAAGQFSRAFAALPQAGLRAGSFRALATVSPLALVLGLASLTPASAASCTPDTTACDAAGGVGPSADRGGPGGAGNGTGGSGSTFDSGTGLTVIQPGSPSSAGNGGAGGVGDNPGGPGGNVGATNQGTVTGALNGAVGTAGANGFNFASGGGGGGAGVYFDVSSTLTVTSTGAVRGGDGAVGGAGTSGTTSNGGGGGGGGAGAIVTRSNVTVRNDGAITGGNGGTGGGGGNAGGGGGGGDGLLVLGPVTAVENSGSITGGIGGSAAAGSAGNSTAGNSGAGINFVSSFLLNNGGTITGGAANGAAAGVGVMTNGNVSINNFGTISGGLNNDGTTHAAAIRFGGTGNDLNLFASSTFIGDLQLISGAGATIGSQSAGLTLGTNIVLGSGSVVSLDVGRLNFTVSGVISGAGSVATTNTGPPTGPIVLSGTNTYTGGTTLAAGTLSVSSEANLGATSGALTFTGGTLRVTGTTYTGTSRTINWNGGAFDIADANNNFAVSQAITGNGALTKTGAGTLTFTGNNSYAGGTTIAQGTLQLGNGGATGAITGDVVNNGVFAVNRSNTYTFGGNISGSGAFEQRGGGTTILTGTNSYGGGTTISQGTLSVASDTNLGAAAGGLNFSNGGTLQVTGTSFTTTTRAINLGTGGGAFDIADAANTLTLGQTITGNGALTKTGAGTLTLTGVNSYSGGTIISGGTLSVERDNNLGAALGAITFNNGTLINTLGSTSLRNITLAGNGTIQSDVYLQFNGVVSGGGALQVTGAGILALVGNNTYTGGTTIATGSTLQVGNGFATGAIVGDVVNNGRIIFYRSDDSAFAGAISGSGLLTKNGNGTLTLSGNNSYAGGTQLLGGTLSVSSDANLGAATGALTFGGGTLQVTGTSFTGTSRTITWGGGGFDIADANNNFALSQAITGNGALTKTGAGTLTFTGNNNYTGGTTIAQGTLQLGNGGVTGAITGDVVNNGVFAINRSDTYTLSGNISGSGAFAQRGIGTTILTGTNTYAGGTTIARGTLSVSSDTNLGAATGALNFSNGSILQVTGTNFTGTTRAINLGTGGGGFDIANAANTFTLGQAIAGNGSLFKFGAGTLTLTGDSSLTGGVVIQAGTLQLGNGGTTGSFLGQVANNGVFAINRSDTYTFDGPITGNGAFEQRGSGTTVFTGNNTYIGGTTIAQGTLQIGDGGITGAIAGNVTNNGTLAFNRSDAIAFAGAIGGSGNLVKLGAGTLTLNGQSTYAGATAVNAGKLVVGDDSHAGASLASTIIVNNGGTLGGIGMIGGLIANAGGTVAPGNSIGTLNVAGNVSFAAGSFYQVEANAAGQSDKIVATGTATLGGGSVLALAQNGTYAPQTLYTIVTANGGVAGTFADVTSSLTFLTPALTYDLNNVYLTLSRNDIQLGDVAQTPNQRAVASALDTGALTNPLIIAVLNQSAAGARQAFDALSGEVHASAQTAMLDDARYLRDAVMGRLRQSSFAGDTGPMAALGMGGPDVAAMDSLAASSALAYASADRRSGFPIKAPPLAAPVRVPDTAFWAQGIGAWGRFGGDGNAAGMKRDLAGFFSGVDHRFAPNWIAGIAGGYTNSSVRVGDRSSSANIDTAHLAGYVGTTYGALSLRGGAGASFSTLDTSRSVIFPNFFDSTRARYNATTAQVFGEIGYGFNLGRAALEPFAGLAWAHLGTNSFNETGGAAALLGASNSEDVGYTSLGARFATNVILSNGLWLTPRATVAWQHAFGDVTPTAALAFRGLGSAFTTAGVPLARNAALVEGGLDLRVTSQASVGVSYVGQIADRVQDHSVKGSFSWKF